MSHKNQCITIKGDGCLPPVTFSQPANFECYGLQPVPPELRKGGIWPLFNIFCNYFINPGTLITSGMMIVAGLSFQATVMIQVIAAMAGIVPLLLLSEVGVRYGIPGKYCAGRFLEFRALAG